MNSSLTDAEIAANTQMEEIVTIAGKLGVCEDDLELFGRYKAKLSLGLWEKIKKFVDRKSVV